VITENYEILDLISLECYKKIEKISVSKFKVQKKMINEIRTVCKNGDLAVIFRHLSQFIGLLFLSDSSANF